MSVLTFEMNVVRGVEAAAAGYVRQNQEQISDNQKAIFRNCILKAAQSGLYSQIVNTHADMSHRQHSMSGAVGSQRFLPWHRDYLLKLEVSLRVFDPFFVVPYWDWTTYRRLPDWLADLLPTGLKDLGGEPITVTRNPGMNPNAPDLPTLASITAVEARAPYLPFTLALEGAQPFGAHNQVHVWVGGTMNDLMYSPADPVFWLHHAFCDKLWSIWQAQNSSEHPDLSGADAVLDPWAESAQGVESIGGLGYSYA